MTAFANHILQTRFRFAFPAELSQFWEFTQELAASGLALDSSPIGIRLGNLFRAFDRKNSATNLDELEDRFYKDPPEFITVLLGDTDGLHWGYYVDEPVNGPSCVAHYYHNDAYQFIVDGGLFDAVGKHAESVRRSLREYMETDSASAESYRQGIQQVDSILERLVPLMTEEPAQRAATAPTRDGMGIIVPPDKYAPLSGAERFLEPRYTPTAAEVHKFRELALSALQHGYAGTALKLGKDLWDYPDYFDISCELLDKAYSALGSPVLRDRLQKGRENRKKMDAAGNH